MNASKNRATLQILLLQSQTSNGLKIVRDSQLKPIQRTEIPNRFAAKRRDIQAGVNYVQTNIKRINGELVIHRHILKPMEVEKYEHDSSMQTISANPQREISRMDTSRGAIQMTEFIKRKPDYTGVVQISEVPDAYTDIGKIALWKNDPNGHNNPSLRGKVMIGEKTYIVSLWIQ